MRVAALRPRLLEEDIDVASRCVDLSVGEAVISRFRHPRMNAHMLLTLLVEVQRILRAIDVPRLTTICAQATAQAGHERMFAKFARAVAG